MSRSGVDGHMLARVVIEDMNESHLQYLASPEWALRLQTDLLPWIERSGAMGADVLEIGPGPGLTTDILRTRAAKVTAVEIDDDLFTALAERLDGTNVEVLHGDATTLPFEAGRFSAVAAFSVLHHIPTVEEQDQLLREAVRVLAPGAAFFVTDAIDVEMIRDAHHDDTFNPLPPESLVERLGNIGFDRIELEVTDREIRFSAHRPS
jgi:SAM-dependent methyltransferase